MLRLLEKATLLDYNTINSMQITEFILTNLLYLY
jgi:hypothetical protein